MSGADIEAAAISFSGHLPLALFGAIFVHAMAAVWYFSQIYSEIKYHRAKIERMEAEHEKLKNDVSYRGDRMTEILANLKAQGDMHREMLARIEARLALSEELREKRLARSDSVK